MYAKARRGEIKEFTGINNPYELPRHAEMNLDTVNHLPEQNAPMICNQVMQRGFVRSGGKLQETWSSRKGYCIQSRNPSYQYKQNSFNGDSSSTMDQHIQSSCSSMKAL